LNAIGLPPRPDEATGIPAFEICAFVELPHVDGERSAERDASAGTFRAEAREPRNQAMLELLLLIVIVTLLVGALPAWPHSRGWGYFPAGTLGTVLLVVVLFAMMGRI
jgi:hypothetical protein